MNTRRILFAASDLPSTQARAIVSVLLCSSTRRARQINFHKETRDRLRKKIYAAIVRVIKFAKHETLRKLHRFMYVRRPIQGQDASDSDANQIGFDREALRQDLLEMVRTQLPEAVQAVSNATLESVGYSDPWKFPAQSALDLLGQRENLLSGISDEIFADIQKEIAAGLKAGESLDQLAQRISAAFDHILEERAALIADTETSAAYGFASDLSARQAGVQFKQWIHAGLPAVPREDHLEIDGLIVPMDEPYPVGDPPLMYPHDPDGSAEDVINCGCISIPATQEDYDDQESPE
jgi:uncharacterized protein with gpF-like domain